MEDIDYAVALGRMCGCGECRNCWTYEAVEWNKAWEEGSDERAKQCADSILAEMYGWKGELKTFLREVK